MFKWIQASAILCWALSPILALAESAAPSTQIKMPVIRTDTIVILGASYAKNWNLTGLQGFKVVNKGTGGEQTHEVLGRFDQDVLALNPRAVILWGFINDIFRSSPEDLPGKLARTRQNIQFMVDQAVRHRISPLLVTEVTMPSPTKWSDRAVGWLAAVRGKQSYREYVNLHVRETNRWIRNLALERKLVLLDFEVLLADKQGNRKLEYTTEDGTHLSDQAYVKLTHYVQQLNPKI